MQLHVILDMAWVFSLSEALQFAGKVASLCRHQYKEKRHAFELEMRIEMDDAVNMRLRGWTEKL